MKKVIWVIIVVLIILIFSIYKFKEKDIYYEISNIECYNYFKYNENDKVGVIDKDGNIIIDASYDDIIIPNLEKDIFICSNFNEEKNKVVNSKNEELYAQYDNIEPIKLKNIASVLCYEKNILKYEKDGLYGLIDFDGNVKCKNIYDNIENLQSTEGKFKVEKDGKYGIINLNGKQLVECNYYDIITDDYIVSDCKYDKSGFIVSNKTEDGIRYGYINYKGDKLLNTDFNEIIRINNLEEIYLIVAQNGQYGLYKNNKQIVKPEYQSIEYCDNGGIIIKKNQNYGLINLEGKIIVDIKYESIEESGIYLYAKNNSNNDVYDIDGNIVEINFNKKVYSTSDENYKIVTLLNNDLTYYGIESKDGKSLVNTGYKYLEYLYNGYFIAKDESEKYGVINSNGNKYIDFEYDIIQKIKDKEMLHIMDLESKKSLIYSSKMKKICEITDAVIDVKDEYVVINNDDEEIYIDNDGNIISSDNELIKNSKIKNLPIEIGEYKKVQYSLEDAYYVKEN